MIYVVLAAKESVWCWPASLVYVGLALYVFLDVSLYLEFGLHIFYLVMSVYGWRQWTKGSAKAELSVSQLQGKFHLVAIVLGLATTGGVGYFFLAYTDQAMPLLDAFITIFSLFATWLVTRKVLENWLYWVVIDIAGMMLYADRGLFLFAALYFFYTIIAIVGYFRWRKSYLKPV